MATEIRPLANADTIADTIRDVLPTARSTQELRVWCTELADKVETYSNLAPGEVDKLERSLADDRIVELERQLAELQRVSTESAAHWQARVAELESCSIPLGDDEIRELQSKVMTLESLVVPLLAVEMRAVRICREVNAVSADQTPTTAELVTILDALPQLMVHG